MSNPTTTAARTGQDAQTYELQHLRTGPFLARRTATGQLFIVARFDDEVELAEQERVVAALNSHAALVEALGAAQNEARRRGMPEGDIVNLKARAALALAKGGAS